MLERRIGQEIRNYLNSDRREALMVTGARQVGKTYIIRECAKEDCWHSCMWTGCSLRY